MGGNNNTDNKPPNDAAEPQCKIFSENSILAFLNPYIPHLAMAYVMFCFAGYTCMGRHLKGEGPMFEPLVFLLIRHLGFSTFNNCICLLQRKNCNTEAKRTISYIFVRFFGCI